LQQDFTTNNHLGIDEDAFEKPISTTCTAGENTGTSLQAAQHVTQLDSLPLIASTVPDSQVVTQAESLLQTIPTPQASSLVEALQRMSSQNASPHDTQPLSPSVYDNIIKNRSAFQPGQNESSSHNFDITQGTLNEGDDGHVDLLSSYKPNDGANDSDADDFSPTQTQTRLPEFPESLRFKTPATVGKKRDCNRDVENTPALLRNPLARNGAPTPGKMMGLSQAFAATQAASSPFVNSLPQLLPSDLPSPNIEVQARPATVSSSSPLLELRRNGNEPSGRYVPVKESQTDRELRAKSLGSEDFEDGSDDDFDDVPSLIVRQRRQRERERAAQRQLKAASSPNRPRSNNINPHLPSSPVKPHLSSPQSSPHADRRSRRLFLPELADQENKSSLETGGRHESEEETDHESEAEIAVKRSSQPPILTEEDKENGPYEAVRVPETTARLQQVMNSFAIEEGSPSIRHSSGGSPPDLDQRQGTRGDTFAVADSQSSQSKRGSLFKPATKLVSSGEGTDCVPQSQPVIAAVEAEKPDWVRCYPNTIPETTSVPPARCLTAKSSNLTSSVLDDGRQKAHTLRSQSQFETAPSHLSTSPRGTKRRHMTEILTQVSPERLSNNIVNDILAELEDPELHDVFGSQSPIPPGRQSKRIRLNNKRVSPPRQQNGFPSVKSALPTPQPEQNSDSDGELQPELSSRRAKSTVVRSPLNSCEPHLQLLPKGPVIAQAMSSNPTRKSRRPFRSVWEVQASPPAKSPTQIRSIRQDAQISAPRHMHNGKDPSRLQSATQPKPITPVFKPADLERTASTAPTVPEMSGLSRSTGTGDIIAPNQIWACFNGKSRAYYPARCLGISGSDRLRYQVQWEGYAPDEVDAHGVRRLFLRIGDVVKVNLEGFPKYSHSIRGFEDKIEPTEAGHFVTDVCGYKTLLVAPKQRKSAPIDLDLDVVKKVPVAAIYLDSNMWGQMKDRDFEYLPSASLRTQSHLGTPSERPSTPSTPSSRSRRTANSVVVGQASDIFGIFSNMAFAISYDDPARKTTLANLLCANSGLLLGDGFHELLQLDSMELKPQSAGLGFTALLADRHSRKEKYMQALALNLPCISGKWIEVCVTKQTLVDWQPYLLPAGESLMLEGATRSRVLPNTDLANTRLSNVLDARPNFFNGASVIVVMGRGKPEAKRKPYLFLTRALGAGRIERVDDAKCAKALLIDHDFDWVLVDDREVQTAKTLLQKVNQAKAGPKVVGNEFIVQSLILGKLYEE
jgi:DNA repair protein Crb2 Tudor domain